MTSEETTISENPPFVAATMAKILLNADIDSVENSQDWSDVEDLPENDWSLSVAVMAELNDADAIVVFAPDTAAATEISCRRPNMPIIAVCDKDVVANQLALSRVVRSIVDAELFASHDAAAAAAKCDIKGTLVSVCGCKRIVTLEK